MRFVPFIAALLAGLAQAASIAAPWNGQPQWWLQLLSLAVLAGVVQHAQTWRRAAVLAWIFATAWLSGTFWWLFISMHVYGGLASPLAAAAVLLLAGFLALDYVLAGAVLRLARPRHPLLQSLAFAGAWLLAELLRGTVFTGFPWGASGYAHVDGPLAALAPFIGVYGIAAVAAFLAYWLAALVQPSIRTSWRSWIVVGAATALLAACNFVARPGDTAPGNKKLAVALLQGNIPQDEKFEGGKGIPAALQWYGEQLNAATAPLVVTPETAIPLLPKQLPEGYLDAMAKRFAQGSQAALVGIPLGSFEEGYSNSVLGFAPGAPQYRFDKHHLVPFGEFIPPLFKWFTRLMNIPLGDFNRGALAQPAFAWAGERLAPNICYEDLFGEELAARFADAAQAPTIFVNMSNIAWFGDSVAIDQHLAISRMRAIEFDRPVIRATNTGATAIVDHRGAVTQQLPRLTRGVLAGDVEGRTTTTPYVSWLARFGLLPLWLLGLAAAAAGVWRRREEARP
ncbi:apolipoprotein N-acyltransferase [Ramlibacter sp. PS4R-6]|uniref:apolipoprotein N-acyltransferase n=1 Tax=Ramlibacter sp. PS4R-6 TaxID=3133438 RepID=UPI0030AF99EF